MVTNGRMEAITSMGIFPASFAFSSASSTDPVVIVVVSELLVRLVVMDAASHLLVAEERIKRFSDKLLNTELELVSTRTQLIKEMEKNMLVQTDLCKYMAQACEWQQVAMKSGSTSVRVYPRESRLRAASSSSTMRSPHAEWIAQGYDNVLVAAMFGEVSTLEWLVALGASLDSKSLSGEDAVFLASEFGQLEMLQWLVKQGAKKDSFRSRDGLSALHVAVANNHASVVQWMIHNGWNASLRLENGDTIAHTAARLGNAETLLHTCAALEFEANAQKETPLHVAAKEGQFECAKTLMRSKEALQSRDAFGLTPMLASVMADSEPLVSLMLDYGASHSETDLDGSTAFILACFKGNLSLAQRLLTLGSNINERNNDGNSALSIASYTGNLDVVNWLLENGADVLLENSAGNTPLFLAAYSGHLKLAQLLDSMTPLSGTYPLGTTHSNLSSSTSSITLSTDESDSATYCLLESSGIGHSGEEFGRRRNKNGSTLLIIASMLGDVSFIKWCLSKGSSVEEKDNRGITPLIAACMSDNVEALHFLISSGSPITQSTLDGLSSLQMAAYYGSCSIIEYLVEQKKLPHVTPNMSVERSPLALASMNGHLRAVQLFIKYGVTVVHRYAAARVAKRAGLDHISDFLLSRAYSICPLLNQPHSKTSNKQKDKKFLDL